MVSPSSACPFCNIASAYPPVAPSAFLNLPHPTSTAPSPLLPSNPDTQAHLILSTQHVLAFLDIMPLTKGHILVVPREHHEKLADVGVRISREIGQWLPVISRVAMRTLFGEEAASESGSSSRWNWNVVQNNGVSAAQLVPHVHFHVIPRPATNAPPSGGKVSFVMFGRGQRDELDDEEGEALARLLREDLAREVQRVMREEGVDLNGQDGEDGKVLGKL
ncbi:HIT-like protein [Aspergillus steynii IBT 23096]|uniref:HIT-like protein n=1 Tax=Aspergillus steynii IBT 23096 TaxID=1392250 RepID=A0A2I2GQI6_9EURO|nr:HIT-like protein [Aspergillus steynii IBT 23096]PLB55139.1 HIT-like protein [Aspergillus steynii IBT 23096]